MATLMDLEAAVDGLIGEMKDTRDQRDFARYIAVKLEAENAMLLHAIEQAIAALDSGAPDIARDFLVTATNYARGAL